jgi:hypothetical protein
VAVLLGEILEEDDDDDDLSGRFRDRPFFSLSPPPPPEVDPDAFAPGPDELVDRETLREGLPAPPPPLPPPPGVLRGGGPSSFCSPPMSCIRRARDAFSSRPDVAMGSGHELHVSRRSPSACASAPLPCSAGLDLLTVECFAECDKANVSQVVGSIYMPHACIMHACIGYIVQAHGQHVGAYATSTIYYIELAAKLLARLLVDESSASVSVRAAHGSLHPPHCEQNEGRIDHRLSP